MTRTIELNRIYKKINWRLLPFLLLCYTLALIDRTNIGFAKLQMQLDVGISEATYGMGAGIFFLGYVLFEVPSNLYLEKIGARKTFSRIMVLWGLTSSAMLFVNDVTTFYILRFLLGVFEAGFAPGVIFYLTYWYSSSRMAKSLAIFMTAGLMSGIVVGPLSGWLISFFDGSNGLKGWQWMFLIEGIPCVLLGIVAFFFLDDKPADATWLTSQDKALLQSDIPYNQSAHSSLLLIFKDARVYVMAMSYFCLICGIYTIQFWLPTILKNAGIKDVVEIGLYSTVPYIVAGICMHIFARSSDHFQERGWHSSILACLGSIALFVGTLFSADNFSFMLISISCAAAFIWSSYSIFWTIPSAYFKGGSGAGGIALVNSIGLLGGFVSPTLIGWAHATTGSLHAGLYLMSGLLMLGGFITMLNKVNQNRPTEFLLKQVNSEELPNANLNCGFSS